MCASAESLQILDKEGCPAIQAAPQKVDPSFRFGPIPYDYKL